MTTHSENIQRRATIGGGEGDPAASTSDIQDYTENELSDYATVVGSEAGLSPESEARANQGPFFDIDDVLQWMEIGSLLHTDNSGNPIVNPIVEIVARYDDYWESEVYEIYIIDAS